MLDIMKYLKTKEVPKDKKQAHKICIQVVRFALINEQFYRWSFGGPYLKCLSELESKYVIVKLHKDVYNNHLRKWT